MILPKSSELSDALRRLARAAGDLIMTYYDRPIVARAKPDVYNHNVETVPRLYATVRRGAQFAQSIDLLRQVKAIDASIFTKSGLMVGLGEETVEVLEVMDAMRGAGVDFLTIGQYLQPTPAHLPVQEYVDPAAFDAHRRQGEALGFRYVASGPLVRSSYRAGELFIRAAIESRRADANG